MTEQFAQRRCQRTERSASLARLLLCLSSLLLLFLTFASISAKQAGACKDCSRLMADKNLLARESSLVAFFHGATLFTAPRLQSRVKHWEAVWRLRPLFSRSHAFKRFVHKTQVLGAPLVMNAGLVFFDPSSSRFTHSVASLTPRTQIVMAFRASLTEWGPSDIALARLDAHWQPVSGAGTVLARAHRIGNGWYGPPWREDPRLVPTEKGLAVAYTLSCAFERNRHGFQVWQRQGFALIDLESGTLSDDIFFSIGNNHDFRSAIYPSLEKNWQFFEHGGMLHVVYSTQPFCVYRTTNWTQRSIEKVSCSRWYHNAKFVDLRGSTPPVRVGDIYFMFAHSPTYEVYTIAFLAERFEILAVSKVPLLQLQPKRAFVCGAVYVAADRTWFLSMGIDDFSIAVYKLDHSTVVMNLLPVQPAS